MRMDVVLPLLVRCSSVLFACAHSYFRPGVLEVLPSLCSLSTAIPFVFIRRIVLAALVFSLSATVLPCAALLAWLCCAGRAEFASRCCLYMCAARLCCLYGRSRASFLVPVEMLPSLCSLPTAIPSVLLLGVLLAG